MGDKTGIEWTDATLNPMRGCRRVSSGCVNCYAEGVAGRFCGPGQPYEGLVDETSKGFRWNGKGVFLPEKLEDPLRWKKPRKVFVNSMSDVFFQEFSFEQIAALFAVMTVASKHQFQVLTKRPERGLDFFEQLGTEAPFEECLDCLDAIAPGAAALVPGIIEYDWPAPNVWMGVSVENQQAADARIPALLQMPAAVRFLSCEPLLGPVDLAPYLDGLDWVIVGGESGPRARPMDAEWARSLRDQCVEAGVPFFFKQWGAHDEHGKRVGKKSAGKQLDGEVWQQYPNQGR